MASKKDEKDMKKSLKEETKLKKNVYKKKHEKKKEKNKKEKTKKEKFIKATIKEMKNVRFPNKKEMIKYSISTIVFIIFFGILFFAVNLIFAWLKQVI